MDFGRTVTAGGVAMEAPRNQDDLMLSVEVESTAGTWEPVSSRMEQQEVAFPPRMRRAAAEELKASGVNWIVLTDAELMARDFLERSNQWGITQVAASQPYRLWRID